jgi:hypothetical protein
MDAVVAIALQVVLETVGNPDRALFESAKSAEATEWSGALEVTMIR